MEEEPSGASCERSASDLTVSAGPGQEKTLVLSGKLQNMPLPDLAQTLESNRKTGVVEIVTQTRTGKVAFLDGAIVASSADRLTGAAAVYRLLGYDSGDFAFYAQSVTPASRSEDEPGLPAGVQGLLMEGMRHLDEVERLKAEIPGPDVVLALPATPQGDEIFSLSEAALSLFTSIDSDATYNELVRSSDLCDLELSQSIKELITRGFLIALDQERQVPQIRLVPDFPGASVVPVSTELDEELTPASSSVGGRIMAGVGVLAGCAAVAWGVINFGVLDPEGSAQVVAGSSLTGAEAAEVGGTGEVEEPVIAPAALHPTCPVGMQLVTGGKFYRGSQSEERIFANARPAHAVRLDAYCLDTYEVTVKQYRECSKSGECERAHRQVWWPKPASKTVAQWKQERRALAEHCNENGDERLNHPVNCVTWSQAKEYCEHKGGHLPSEAQWEYAARGGDGRVFPWGDHEPSAKHLNGCGEECRQRREHDGLDDIDPMYPGDDGYATTAPVGSFPDGVGQWGHQDLIGNVFEWTADAYVPYASLPDLEDGKKVTLENPVHENGERRVIRGGAFNSYRTEFTNPALRGMMPADARTHGIGFRCAAEPIMQ